MREVGVPRQKELFMSLYVPPQNLFVKGHPILAIRKLVRGLRSHSNVILGKTDEFRTVLTSYCKRHLVPYKITRIFTCSERRISLDSHNRASTLEKKI